MEKPCEPRILRNEKKNTGCSTLLQPVEFTCKFAVV